MSIARAFSPAQRRCSVARQITLSFKCTSDGADAQNIGADVVCVGKAIQRVLEVFKSRVKPQNRATLITGCRSVPTTSPNRSYPFLITHPIAAITIWEHCDATSNKYIHPLDIVQGQGQYNDNLHIRQYIATWNVLAEVEKPNGTERPKRGLSQRRSDMTIIYHADC
jgi:hypothetical protein